MTVQARSLAAVVVFMVGWGVGLATGPPSESPIELLSKAKTRPLDTQHAGPISLRYVLRFPDGKTGVYVRCQRDEHNYREETQIGTLVASRGVLSGKGWETRGDDANEAWWLVSALLAFNSQLTPQDGLALEARELRVSDRDFLEVRGAARKGGGNWVVFLSSPTLDLGVSDIGFERRTYVDWKELRGAGMVPGACRIYIQGDLALEMTLERATNKPIGDAELAPPATAVARLHCAGVATDPKLVGRTAPVFPEAARLDRAQGLVVLSGLIEVDGSVANVRLVHAPKASRSSQELLVDAAIAAVKNWRYEPPQCDGAPTATELLIRVSFTLE